MATMNVSLLRERKQKREVLLRLLQEGHAAAEAGKTRPLTSAILRDIADRAREHAS
jgi:hypothetical protein